MLDRGRRFILLIARPDLPKFAANKRDAGTPEENNAVLAGLLAFLGTYSVSEADQVLILRPEASRFPNWVGADQKRYLTLSKQGEVYRCPDPKCGCQIGYNC